jgi:hypothetical protein
MPTDPPGKSDNRQSSHRRLVFRVEGYRLRPPQTITEVTVQFGERPAEEIRLHKFGMKRQLLLRATILEPAALRGHLLSRFYNLPANGRLPIGADLMADIQTMLGRRAEDGEELEDLNVVFGSKTARVKLRRVEWTTRDGKKQPLPLEQQYCVMGQIIKANP